MNITDLARRLRVSAEELREKLPELGFDIGQKALKVPDRDVGRIMGAWNQYKKRQHLEKKRAEQRARAERKEAVQSGDAEEVELPAVMTVREFAELLNLPIQKVMQELMRAGVLASLNENIDFDTASIIAEYLGVIAKRADGSDENAEVDSDRIEEVLREDEDAGTRTKRPPVIVVMGHVDHCKTLLLDTIRKTNIVSGESGGITQHIGAYQVEHNDKKLTFIDTPGHEAFTVMRSRGAKVADIAILVIAADDGVKPQTREAVDIIKASGMPFLVAINKIDKPGANIDRVKGELTEFNMIPEDYGGKTIVVPVSAKSGDNIDGLLDNLLLLDEIHAEDIQANPNRKAIGTIIESHIDKGQGPVATVLVQAGTLRRGDILGVSGVNFGKVRAMKAWDGQDVVEAGPSTPVKLLGLKDAPSVGDILEVPEDAKDLEKMRAHSQKHAGASDITVSSSRVQSDDADGEERVVLNVILKADVLGSLEAIIGMLEKIDNPYVQVKIITKGLGNVTDAEILQAEAADAFVGAFNVKLAKSAQHLAREKKVEVGEYSVIYKLFDDIVEKLRLLIPAEKIYTELGAMEILGVFKKVDNGMVVGGRVNKGTVEREATARVVRDDEVIGEGLIKELQSGKQDVREVQQGAECGILFEGKTKIEVGDILEIYREDVKERKLVIE